MKFIHLLRRCHLPAMLLLSVFSAMTFFLAGPNDQSVWPLAVFPLAYTLLAPLLIAAPGHLRMPVLFTVCVLGIAAGFRLFPDNRTLLLMPAAGTAALFFALSYANKAPEETSPFFYVITFVAQAATLFLLHFSSDQNAAGGAMHLFLYTDFVLYVFLLLLAFSRISMNNATLSRYRLPGVISRSCTLLTVCFFFLALALSSIPVVIAGVHAAFRLLRSGIWQILLFLVELLPAESAGGGQGGPMPMLPVLSGVIEQKPSFFSVILEKAAVILTVVVIITGSIILLRMLVRLLLRLARFVLNRLQHYTAAVTEDYEDEITDTRQEEADRSINLLRRRLDRRTAVYPDTPAGEIRRSYARLLRAHKAWSAGSTARENLPENAASLYERARYSTHPITKQDAGAFQEETRHL